jgi:hypothetical protein
MLNAILLTFDQSVWGVLLALQQHIVLATAIACGASSAGAIFIVCVVVYKLHRERQALGDAQTTVGLVDIKED